ncbi:MAG: hypothetical protein AAF215_27180 [Cyanobacteria bacterium P01_A01_bin.123]
MGISNRDRVGFRMPWVLLEGDRASVAPYQEGHCSGFRGETYF